MVAVLPRPTSEPSTARIQGIILNRDKRIELT